MNKTSIVKMFFSFFILHNRLLFGRVQYINTLIPLDKYFFIGLVILFQNQMLSVWSNFIEFDSNLIFQFEQLSNTRIYFR